MYAHERSLVEKLADKPFALIGVNSDRDLDKIRETVKEKRLTWRSFQNEEGVDGKISDKYGVKAWPTILILDKDGVIRFKGNRAKIDEEITKLLKEMGHDDIDLSSHDDDDENGEKKK